MFLILKGSCGKSTSVANLSSAIANQFPKKHKVLMIDLDPQADLSKIFNVADNSENIHEVLLGKKKLAPVRINENLFIIPSSENLYSFKSNDPNDRFRLRTIVDSIKENFDFIFIDCHADMSLLNMNAFTTSDKIFIPVKADYLSVSNVPNTIKAMEQTMQNLNTKLTLGGLFLTFYDNRILLHRQAKETLSNLYKEKLLSSTIRSNTKLAESPALGIDIFSYDAKSTGAKDYYDLALELIMK